MTQYLTLTLKIVFNY